MKFRSGTDQIFASVPETRKKKLLDPQQIYSMKAGSEEDCGVFRDIWTSWLQGQNEEMLKPSWSLHWICFLKLFPSC